MPRPLIEKRFTSDPLNLRFNLQYQNTYLETHPLYKKLSEVIFQGKPDDLSRLLQNFDTTPIINKQLLFLMLENVYYYGCGKGMGQVKWRFENIGLNLIAVLIKNLPQLIIDVYYLQPYEIKILKEKGVDIKWEAQGCNLLYVSMMNPNFDKFDLLCWLVETEGFNINSNNLLNGTGTVLHAYLANEDFDTAEKIVKRFGSKLDLSLKDKEGKTLLIIASKTRATEVLKLLCNLPQLTSAIINMQDEEGRSALHYACMLCMTTCVNLLIEKGADINIQDKKDNTPLHVSTFSKLKISAVLMSIEIHPDRAADAPRNALPNVQDNDRREILATKHNQLQYQGQVSLSEISLIDAIVISQLNIVAILLENGAKLIPNTEGKFPIDLTEKQEIKQLLRPKVFS